MQRWAVMIIRGDGSDLDPIRELFGTQAEAIEYAQRCCSWFQCVRGVAVCPVRFDIANGIPIETGKVPVDLFNQTGG